MNRIGVADHIEPIARPLLGVVLVLAVFLLAGCGSKTLPPSHEPALSQCDAKCYVPCADVNKRDTGVRWEGDANDPKMWDRLATESSDGVVDQLTDKLLTCEVARKSCVQCLNRLEQQKVIIQ